MLIKRSAIVPFASNFGRSENPNDRSSTHPPNHGLYGIAPESPRLSGGNNWEGGEDAIGFKGSWSKGFFMKKEYEDMRKLLKRTICCLIPIFIIFPVLSSPSQERQDIGSQYPEIPVSEQSKILLEKNLSLKTNLSKFLYFNSCGNGKQRDYKGIYTLLSQNYLTERFPNIHSAAEYVDVRENRDEVYHHVVLLIEHIEYIQNDVVKIKLQLEAASEGDLRIIEEEIFFRNENGSWKYDGIDVDSMKTIKMLEE